MTYGIEYERRAFKYLQGIPQPDQRRVTDRIAELGMDPRGPNVEKLRGVPGFRVRQGNYWIIFTIDDGASVVTITKIGQRGDVYR